MTRYYCDGCEEEIDERNYIDERLKRSLRFQNGNMVNTEVMAGIDKVRNGGVLCLACLLKVLTEGAE